MMHTRFDLIVRNGTVVTAADSVQCDIGIRDGRIAALADTLGGAEQEINAAGRLVLPGGIDSHCHIEEKSSTGLTTAGDFYTAGIAAACGGTTTLIAFSSQRNGSLLEALQSYHERAQSKAFVDYAFHVVVSDAAGRELEHELHEIIRYGCPSLKIFMTYESLKLTDREILDVLTLAKRERALVMVHAENSDAISWLTERLTREGKTAPRFHAVSRPQSVEREATHRIIMLAELVGTPILIVHVSAKDALEQIRWARNRGLPIYAETCPQYFLLTAADLDRPGFEGAKYVCSPPPRSTADHEAVWEALAGGLVQVFSSDHAPYPYQGTAGKQAYGIDAPFHKIPNGLPGLETRLPLLFSEGVAKGRIDIRTFVALAATNAAKLYGLYPQKGSIAVGSDADLAIWDPAREATIRREILHDPMDYSPYDGVKVTGWPVITIARGEILWADGTVSGRAGRGRFLPRKVGPSGPPGPIV